MDHIVESSSRLAPNATCGPLFAPLHAPVPTGCSFVLGRIAQSLDGYIATRRGESVWISGPDDLRHTHQLRALCDAVVVGAKTVRADNPRLTTRLVDGPSPVRVVLDPDCRLDDGYRVFSDGPETLLLCAPDTAAAPNTAATHRHGEAHVLPVPRGVGGPRRRSRSLPSLRAPRLAADFRGGRRRHDVPLSSPPARSTGCM